MSNNEPPVPDTTFLNVEHLSITGAMDLRIEADDIISGLFTAQLDEDDELTIRLTAPRLPTQPWFDQSGLLHIGSNTFGHVSVNPGSFVMINGVQITPALLAAARRRRPPPRTVMRIIQTTKKIERITCTGSCRLPALPRSLLSDKLTVTVTGSGGLVLQGKYKAIDVAVTGSGSCTLSKCAKLTAAVTGSGSVRGVHVTKSARLTLLGSGSIVGTAAPNANVVKRPTGEGRIVIQRVAEDDNAPADGGKRRR